MRSLADEEARVARQLIDAGIDARYEVVPAAQYVRRFRRAAGREAPIPAGFVDRDGKVFLPEGEVGAAGPPPATPAAATAGAAETAGGPVRELPPPRVVDGEPISPGGARAAEGRPPAQVRGGSAPVAATRATSFREIGEYEAGALARAFEAGLAAPPDRTTFPRPEMYEEEFRALFGPDAPLPANGYVTNTGYRIVAPTSEAGELFWH